MIVMKFGGTSVKDRDAILRVTEIVRGRMADKPLVVVSALSQVTRVLCNIAEVAETQCAEKAESLLAPLREGICPSRLNCCRQMKSFRSMSWRPECHLRFAE